MSNENGKLKHRWFIGVIPLPIIIQEPVINYWLFEDGDRVLLENNDNAILENN